MANLFSDYERLLGKVSAKFSEIEARNSIRMQCGKGCHQCCMPGLTVFRVEKEYLKKHIQGTPGLAASLKRLEKENPHRSQRCRFLEADGACAVYEARPVICRSHGAPIYSKDAEGVVVDVCPLNFRDVQDIPPEDFINLEILNNLLVLINRRFEDNEPAGGRFELRVDEILS